MNDLNKYDTSLSKAQSALARLADTIGCFVEDFSNCSLESFRDTETLLDLWLSIEDVQDRAKVLAFVRAVSDRARTPGEPVALAHAMQKPE